jgi:uncharacterized membrane protein
MNKTRLEAFSDGVFAIIITIMVLELKIPKGVDWEVIRELLPKLYCYALSFVFIGIYWGNHHHLMHTLKRVNASVIWANMHLLFWLSLVPCVTGWMGENNFDKTPVATYGGLLLLCGISFTILSITIGKTHREQTELVAALGKDKLKATLSTLFYILSILAALFAHPFVSEFLFLVVSVMWLIPSKAIEKAIANEG